MKKRYLYILLLCLGILLMLPTVAYTAGPPGCIPINYSDIRSGFLDSTTWFEYYCFSGTAGDPVSISMTATSGDLDTYLTLYKDDGTFIPITENDDVLPGSNSDSSIEINLPVTGAYIIEVSRYDFNVGTTSGNYDLSLFMSGGIAAPDSDGDGFNDSIDLCPAVFGVAPDGCPAPSTGSGTGSVSGSCTQINYGDILSGFLDSTTWFEDYCFSGTAGAPVTILTSTSPGGNLDTYLKLYKDDGTFIPLEENDDEGSTTTDSRIALNLPVTGDYIIEVTRNGFSSGTTSGNYELSLITHFGGGAADSDGDGFNDTFDSCWDVFGVAPDGCPATGTTSGGSATGTTCPNPLVYGASVTGNLTNTVFFEEYCFAGQAGDQIQIFMGAISGGLDTFVAVGDIAIQMASNDDDPLGGTDDSFLEFTLPTTGEYFIGATRFGDATGTSTGSYSLNLALVGNTSSGTGVTIPPNRSSTLLTQLDHLLSPYYGTVVLNAGFQPDPYRVDSLSGGMVDASYLGCSGFYTSNPDFMITWSGVSQNLRLYFEGLDPATGSDDTAIVVRLPDGSFICNDDSFNTLSPTVDIANPARGDYAVWVGTFSANQIIPGTLFMTTSNFSLINKPSAPVVGVNCPNTLPSRLIPGNIARVTLGGLPNRVRKGPGTDNSQIGRLVPGALFEVIGGPLCATGYSWYQVSYGSTIGWTAEAGTRDYWVEFVR